MKILYVFRSLAIWGGIERILVDKMNYLVNNYGYDVFLLTANQGDHPIPYRLSDRVIKEDLNIRFHDQYNYKGVHRLWDRFKRIRMFRKKLKNKIRDIKPDIIVCVADGYQVSIVKVKGKIPLLVEAHNNYSYLFQGHGLFQRLAFRQQRRYLLKVQAIVTLTQADANFWKRKYENVNVIPNFVQLNNTGIFSTNDNKRVIFVGRIEEQKRIFDVLDIWQKVFQQYPDWQLNIFGDGSGEYREQVECIYRKQNANIVIHSPTNKIFDYYRKSDLLILTSEYEPFGLVIPEAMSCGLPVVSYRSPFGPESIITDGQDGFLVPLGNKDAFVDRLTFLMGNLSLRQEMGRRAVISSQRYSANIIMPKWKTLFERLVGTNSDT